MAPLIVSAKGDSLRASDGREYLDLSMGYGSVWLGHGEPAVEQALVRQLARHAAPGYLATEALEAAKAALAPFIPATHFVGGFYSTGMEAVEAALRAAWAQSGRLHVAGFEGSEHGRSLAASALGGPVPDGAAPFAHRLPGFAAPPGVLERALERLAAQVELAAIVVEPVQMSGGGLELGAERARFLLEFGRQRAIPVIFDEALTGLYRCGARLYSDLAGLSPDIVILGKGLANGFPCAALVLRQGFAWDRARVRPGSTYWNHPLACAAAAATLGALAGLDAPGKAREIERTVRESLEGLELRGRGAMWCIGFPDPARQSAFAARLLAAGVVTSYYDRFVRLLPGIRIEPAVLRRGCEAIRQAHADTFG